MRGKAGKKNGVEPPRLDADFVRQAPIVELSAEQRAAKQRREELHRQMEEGRKEAERAARRGRRARRRRRIPVVLAVLLIASLVGWNTFARDGGQSRSTSALEARNHGQDQVVDDRPVGDRPPPSKEQTTVPLGRPAPLKVPSDRFAFMRVRPGSNVPVAYDPCRPIHVVVNKRTAPAEADVLLGESLEIINNATGLQFKIDGETTEPPNARRAPYQPDRYPGRWAPVLVAWSDPQEYPEIDGDVAGVGGSIPVPAVNHRVYVTGGVTLDGPSFKTILKRPDGPAEAEAILLHELAHLVGLDHVADPDQLMNSANTGQVSFGPGDLAGLAQLGQGACYPNV